MAEVAPAVAAVAHKLRVVVGLGPSALRLAAGNSQADHVEVVLRFGGIGPEFVMERADHPDIFVDLTGIDRTKASALAAHRNLENPGGESFPSLGSRGRLSLGRQVERLKTLFACAVGDPPDGVQGP
jgi:hypothetical protein